MRASMSPIPFVTKARGSSHLCAASRAALSISALAIAASLASSAVAQTGQGGGTAEQATTDIVVTAERRAMSINTTPIAMSAVAGEQLQERQIVRINDLQTQVPSLGITNNGFTQNVNIRGLGNTTTSPSVTTGVAVFHDGLYQPEAILLNTPFYDIAQVEVLRGPQGTIVGQNSTGGALQINSRNPEIDGGVSGYAEANFGNYASRRVNGAINLPISSTLAARIAFNVERQDSFYTNYGPNGAVGAQDRSNSPGHIDSRNLRLGLLWKPNESFQAVLKADLNESQTGGVVARPRPACDTCSPLSSYYQYGYNGPSNYNGNRTLGAFDIVYNTDETQHDKADRYSLDMKYVFDNGITLRSLSGFQRLMENRVDDSDGSAAPVRATPEGGVQYHLIGPHNDYLSQEINLISPDDGKLTWLIGTSYFYRNTDVHLTNYNYGATPDEAGTEATLIVDSGSKQRLLGLFGQLGYQLADALQLQVGGRLNVDKNTGTGGVTIPLPFGRIFVSQAGTYKKTTPTGKVALNWQIDPANFAYAFYARGYKSGGINDAVTGNFGSEKVDDFEVGLKSRLLDRHLSTQLGFYYMKYSGLQQQVLNPFTTQNSVVNLTNSTIYGIEASAQGHFGSLTLDAGFSYNHSKLGDVTAVASYRLPAGQLGTQCAAGQTVGCFDYTPYYVNLGGESNPYSPKITVNGSIGYDIPIGDHTLTPRVNVSYQDGQYASIFQDTDYYYIKSRTLVDAFLTFKASRWEVEGFVRNLTDKTYVVGYNGAGNAEFYGAPRTYGLRVARQF